MKSWETCAAQISSKILTKGKSFRLISQLNTWLQLFFKSAESALFTDNNRQFSDLLDFVLNLLMIDLNFNVFPSCESVF